MSAAFCPVHQIDFRNCVCPDRRRTDRIEFVIVCTRCQKHVPRCYCAEPVLEVRTAA